MEENEIYQIISGLEKGDKIHVVFNEEGIGDGWRTIEAAVDAGYLCLVEGQEKYAPETRLKAAKNLFAFESILLTNNFLGRVESITILN